MMIEKKHRTAYTSILAWKEVQAKGLPLIEKQQICKYLTEKAEPKNSRQIANDLGVERTNVTRSLNELEHLGIVEVAHHEHCKITGHRCKHYQMKKGAN